MASGAEVGLIVAAADNGPGHENTRDDRGDAADGPHDRGLGHHHGLHLAGGHAMRAQDRDLSRAFQDADAQRVDDPQPGDHDCQQREHVEEADDPVQRALQVAGEPGRR